MLNENSMIKFDHELLVTGIPLIDRQHQEYASLVDQLFVMARCGNVSRTALSAKVDAVLKYAVEHFDAEEHLMHSVNYPAYTEHRAKHNIFRAKTDTLLVEINDDLDTDTFTIRLSRWLIEWFCVHVQAEDLKLATFLKRQTLMNSAPE